VSTLVPSKDLILVPAKNLALVPAKILDYCALIFPTLRTCNNVIASKVFAMHFSIA